MRQQCGGQHAVVRRVCENRLVRDGVVRQPFDHAEPHLPDRLRRIVLQRIGGLDRAEVDRTILGEHTSQVLGQLFGARANDIELWLEGFWRRHVGHRRLMIEAFLLHVKRRRHVEDRFTMLNRRHAAARETAAIAWAVHEVHDRCLEIALTQEVAVHRVRLARRIDRAPRRHECLREHLAAEDAAGAKIAVLPAVDIHFEWLELEQREQIGDDSHAHNMDGASPNIMRTRSCVCGQPFTATSRM